MGLIDRLAGEPSYDEMPEPEPPDVAWDRPALKQDPADPNHWTYTSPPPAPVLHQWVSAEPKLRVKLETHGDPKGDKFYRTWEISFEGTDRDTVLEMVELLDDHLQARYGAMP